MRPPAMRRRPGRLPAAGEAGAAVLLLAVLLPVLLGFVGAAVDVRNGYVVRSMLQHAVDDGAVSAQRWSAQAEDAVGDPSGVLAASAAEALAVARRELASEGIATTASVTATLSGAEIAVTAQSRVPTFFLRALGIHAWTLAAAANALLWGGRTAASSGAPVTGPSSASSAPFVQGPSLPGSLPTGAPREGNNGGNDTTASPAASSPGAAAPAPDGAAAADTPAACNCDAIAAGDPATAAAALDRMGVTPADPGPFAGDLTSELGLGAMQSDDSDSTDATGSSSSGSDSSGSDIGQGSDSRQGLDGGGADAGAGGDDGGAW